jgi:hypothetical protein
LKKPSNHFSDCENIVVIGGGASGMMAAGRAAEMGAKVILLEKMERLGKKILITGKNRCNLTNTKPLKDFIAMYGVNGRFLYPSFRHFFRDALLDFLKQHGVETKTERGGRIFPASDKAGDVANALKRYLNNHGVEIHAQTGVKKIMIREKQVLGVQTTSGHIRAAAVILATGGATYPKTGSSGDGYKMVADAGHSIVPLRPALVPLIVDDIRRAKSMQGVGLRNVRLTAFQCPAQEISSVSIPCMEYGRGLSHKRPRPPVIESRLGEMMFTHFGIGGPITLLMSLSVVDALKNGKVSVAIDLKPALSREQLRNRLQREFDHSGKRHYKNILMKLLPQKMVDPFVVITNISADKPAHQIRSEEKERIVQSLKSLCFNIQKPLPLSSAIVTAGGISLGEIDPRTMGSRIISGLYFCGEVMDIDADTGGYNLQAAFSTGYLAGESAAIFIKKSILSEE